MSRITIPANPGFYRLEFWNTGRFVTRSPIIGWRIYDTEEPRAVCVGGDVKDLDTVATGILAPDGKIYHDYTCGYGDEHGTSEPEWIERVIDRWDWVASKPKSEAA